MRFDWFKKSNSSEQATTNNKQSGTVYDEITKVNSVIYCYCSSLSTVYSNGVKVLKHFRAHVDRESAEEILDGLKFVINEFPSKFPLEKMRISLKNSRAIQIEDTLESGKLSSTCPEYGVSYFLSIGTDGLGWSIHTYDFMGESHLYKNSKNDLYVKDEYSIKNVYEFINATLNALGYASISIPTEKRNFVKAKYADANKKSPEEEYQIGRQYFYGKGKNIDWERAFNHFKNSAEGGNGKGMYYYAYCMLEGKGTDKDLLNGKKWLTKACKANVASAYERLGYAYGFKGEFGEDKEKSQKAFAKAFELFEKDAITGDAEGLYHLAMCYNCGHGVKSDIKKSIELLNKAVEAGNDKACYEMALLYSIGTGVEKNDKESFKWYQKAADMGNIDAFYNIGYCYESGKGVQKDLKKAFEWYMKGAQKSHAYSQYKVGMCFLNGVGTEKSSRDAFVSLNNAAKNGFKDAARIAQQILMGIMVQDF